MPAEIAEVLAVEMVAKRYGVLPSVVRREDAANYRHVKIMQLLEAAFAASPPKSADPYDNMEW